MNKIRYKLIYCWLNDENRTSKIKRSTRQRLKFHIGLNNSYLRKKFSENSYPTNQQYEEMSNETSIPIFQLKNWFLKTRNSVRSSQLAQENSIPESICNENYTNLNAEQQDILNEFLNKNFLNLQPHEIKMQVDELSKRLKIDSDVINNWLKLKSDSNRNNDSDSDSDSSSTESDLNYSKSFDVDHQKEPMSLIQNDLNMESENANKSYFEVSEGDLIFDNDIVDENNNMIVEQNNYKIVNNDFDIVDFDDIDKQLQEILNQATTILPVQQFNPKKDIIVEIIENNFEINSLPEWEQKNTEGTSVNLNVLLDNTEKVNIDSSFNDASKLQIPIATADEDIGTNKNDVLIIEEQETADVNSAEEILNEKNNEINKNQFDMNLDSTLELELDDTSKQDENNEDMS